MTNYRIGIAAHHKRAEQAHALMDTTQAVYLSMDDGTLGCGTNHHKVWSWLSDHDGGTRYLVVLEDDAVPVDGFSDQLEQALAVAPAPIVSLYLGHPKHWGTYAKRQQRILDAGARADEQDACWITTQDLLHGVGVAIRTDLVPSMLSYTTMCDRPYDYAIRNWARDCGHSIAFAWPSLLNHLDLPTLIQHPDGLERGERKAWRTGTREHWTGKAVTL